MAKGLLFSVLNGGYRDTGKENGSYYLRFRVKGVGLRVF